MIKMKCRYLLAPVVLFAYVVFFNSCTSYKHFSYFEDLPDTSKPVLASTVPFKEPVIANGDLLSITIQTIDNDVSALLNNTTGGANIALGGLAGSSLTTGSNNIDIGNVGVAAESNTIRIGKVGTQQATFIAGINGKLVAGGIGVMVDASGHLGTVVSSKRFKDQIRPMDKASEAILALRPVTFLYKHELDPDGIPQFGLVAEQVEKVNPDLVARDDQGKPYTVRYEAVNAMLLNEFLKAHRKIEEQGRTIAQQQKDFRSMIAQQEVEIRALASQLQKVSNEIELTKPAPRVVVNNW
jgi:hypothetical protein